MKSDQINELASALAKAQAEFLVPEKDSVNPHFKNKFASLLAIGKATQAALSKYGLALSHLLTTGKGGTELCSLLMHSSGQWVGSVAPINPQRNDAQGIGSSVSYMKRYNAQALLNVVGDDVEDDDGEAAVGRGRAESPPPPNATPHEVIDAELRKFATAAPPKPILTVDKSKVPEPRANGSLLTPKQINRYFAILRDSGVPRDAVEEYMLREFKKAALPSLSWEQYEKVCDWLKSQTAQRG